MLDFEIKDEQPIEFSIKNSIHAMSVLSKSLYSDPIKAIIRELACNAIDSHVAAGTPEVKFDIIITTEEFSIRDYGTGLAPNELEKIYTTYFESTKETDKDSIGSFGLGSKSPFAYTNEFFVTTFYYGTATTYLAKKENNLLTITKQNVEFTNKQNGLLVSFKFVANYDKNSFWTAAQEVLPFMEGKYASNVYIAELDTLDNFESDNFKILKIEPGLSVVQNCVKYRVDQTKLDLSDKIKKICATYNLVLYFPNKVLSVAPSREELHYDNNTINSINAKIDLVTDEINTLINLIINDGTVFDHRSQPSKLLYNLGVNTYSKEEVYKGINRTYYILNNSYSEENKYNTDYFSICFHKPNKIEDPTRKTRITYGFLLSKDIYVNDLGDEALGIKKIKKIIRNNYNFSNISNRVIYLDSLQQYEQFCVDLALSQPFIDERIKFLSKVSINTHINTNKPNNKDKFITYTSSNSITYVEDISNITCYFLTTYNNPTVFGNTLDKDSRYYFSKFLNNIGIDNVVGVSKQVLDSLETNDWKLVDNIILEKYSQLYYQLCTSSILTDYNILERFAFIKDIPGEKVISHILSTSSKDENNKIKNKYHIFKQIKDFLPKENIIELTIPELDLSEIVYKAYPMLQFISQFEDNTNSDFINIVTHYVKGIINAEHRDDSGFYSPDPG